MNGILRMYVRCKAKGCLTERPPLPGTGGIPVHQPSLRNSSSYGGSKIFSPRNHRPTILWHVAGGATDDHLNLWTELFDLFGVDTAKRVFGEGKSLIVGNDRSGLGY